MTSLPGSGSLALDTTAKGRCEPKLHQQTPVIVVRLTKGESAATCVCGTNWSS